MPRLRPLRDAKEIAAVPVDRPVLIDLSEEKTETEPEKKVEAEIDKVEKVEPEPKPEPEPEPEPEDENPLQKQLEEMKKAEEIARAQVATERARAEAAVRQVREREVELTRERGGREQAEYDAVVNAIGAAQAEADRAQGDLETAMAAQDFKVAADAQRRLATSTARLVHLEDGKAAYETRREEAKTRPVPAPPSDSVDTRIDAMTHLSGRQRDWLKRHPDAITNASRNARLGGYHYEALDAGHSEDSDGYYQYLEEKLGYRKAPEKKTDPEPETRRSPPVSAPVSRDSPSMSTGRRTSSRVELSPEQRDAARIAGVDDVTYAKGVLELERRKKLGMYPDR